MGSWPCLCPRCGGIGRRVETPATDEPEVTITPYVDGPLLVRGDFRIVDPDGVEIDPGRRTVALCRCGRSTRKPFCDGSHKAAGFRAGPSVRRRDDAPLPAAQRTGGVRGNP